MTMTRRDRWLGVGLVTAAVVAGCEASGGEDYLPFTPTQPTIDNDANHCVDATGEDIVFSGTAVYAVEYTVLFRQHLFVLHRSPLDRLLHPERGASSGVSERMGHPVGTCQPSTELLAWNVRRQHLASIPGARELQRV